VPPVIYKDHRGNRLPSVTTIIGRFKESGGLLYWANQQGLEGKTLDQARAEVTTPGTLAHKAVEDHINGRPERPGIGLGIPIRVHLKDGFPARFLGLRSIPNQVFNRPKSAMVRCQYRR
jgi:hypothetical protein